MVGGVTDLGALAASVVCFGYRESRAGGSKGCAIGEEGMLGWLGFPFVKSDFVRSGLLKQFLSNHSFDAASGCHWNEESD